MPQYQSQLGQMGFIKQASVGAAGTIATAPPTRWAKLRSTSVGGERSLMIPDPEIQGAGGRDINRVYLSPVNFTGDYGFYMRSEALPLAIYGAMGGGGGAPTGSAAAGYVHAFTPADTLPAYTIQEQISNGFDVFQYVDTYFNTLHLEAAADAYLMGTLGVAARTQTAGVTPATPAFDATPMFVGSNIVITLGGTFSAATGTVSGGTTLPAANFSLDYGNNMEVDHFVLGSLFVDQMTPKRRTVTGNFTLRPTSNSYFRQAMYGASASTSPSGQVTVQGMTIVCTSYEIISGATSQVYQVSINMPEVIWAPFKPEASGEDTVEHSIDFQAVKIAAANIATVVVTNGVSTAYNV